MQMLLLHLRKVRPTNFYTMPGFDLNLDLLLKLTSPSLVKGSLGGPLHKLASLLEAQTGDVSFLSNKKYRKQVSESLASVIFVPEDFDGEPGEGQVFIHHGNPSRAIDLVAEHIRRKRSPRPGPGVHPTAVVDPSAEFDDTVHIGAFAIIEEGVSIGSHSVIHTRVTIGRFAEIGAYSEVKNQATIADYCKVGIDCIIHAGAVIGSDGFGYETIDGQHLRSPQIGIVVLEDRVDVGSNSTIDRARIHETRIGEGTKIDNLVQIAHNVRIGKGCFLASQVGIAGSTVIGDFVLFGGKSGASGHLNIGDFCQIAGTTAVYQNLPPKSFVSGVPAMPYFQAQKFTVLRKKLPELFRRVSELENHPPSDP